VGIWIEFSRPDRLLERLIEQKQKGERVTVAKTEKPKPVSNILDALRKSLAENKSRPKSGRRKAA